jgi:alpha-galactosidase
VRRFTQIDKLCFIIYIFGWMILSSCSSNHDVTGTSGEMKIKSKWVKEHLLSTYPDLPFSFIYDGKASSELLKTWQKKTEIAKLDSNRTQYTHIWTDEKTGLEVKCVSVDYSDYSAVEWTVYFRNTGTDNSPILKDIQGLDTRFEKNTGEFVLHHNRGDLTAKDSYTPLIDTLGHSLSKRFAPPAGRPTYGAFPYYNLQIPDGGVFIAIGWPGQWAVTFTRYEANDLHIVAGQELTRMSLKPGETVRSPLVAELFWQGTDVLRSHNLWRRWMMIHNHPHPGNKPLSPQIQAASSHFYSEMTKADEASQKMFIDGYLSKGIKLDYWWMDAGWYPCNGQWTKTGTWEVDTTRFPNGLRAVSDYAHARGVKIIVWFEPERVGDVNSWLARNHPEWILEGKLLNLGNPDVQKWAIDHFSKFITEQGVDLYRQDFNIDPLPYWRKADAPDRQGMTENLYVQGYLAYWDGLIARHPGILIDACASGGRRNDLETMRRAVPLLRSDYIIEPVGQQGHTYGLSSWIPFNGTGIGHMWGGDNIFSSYDFRCCMTPAPHLNYDVRPEAIGDFTLITRLCAQWREISPAMLGDYYPLLPYSLADNAWLAWQFDQPEEGKGIIQAFRRDKCVEPSMTFRLRGLNPVAQYEVKNLDQENSTKISGKELMEKGVTIEIKDKPGAVVITYKELR